MPVDQDRSRLGMFGRWIDQIWSANDHDTLLDERQALAGECDQRRTNKHDVIRMIDLAHPAFAHQRVDLLLMLELLVFGNPDVFNIEINLHQHTDDRVSHRPEATNKRD